ncbi:hypothetical protein N752_14100 [Desulforamulus aquiferis]|nr:exonuclease domain-containing protein [Desulforamulus aquiferis]RYD04501.1 hypothetical protein N752_14100 [Desulforamulus aquiferis]
MSGICRSGHNIAFDRDFLRENTDRFTNEIFDTLELSRLLLPAAANHRLADLCILLNIAIDTQHRALMMPGRQQGYSYLCWLVLRK